jgi:hypothetical protein
MVDLSFATGLVVYLMLADRAALLERHCLVSGSCHHVLSVLSAPDAEDRPARAWCLH